MIWIFETKLQVTREQTLSISRHIWCVCIFRSGVMEAVAFTGGVLLVAVHCREHGREPLLYWARLVGGLVHSILAYPGRRFFFSIAFRLFVSSFANLMWYSVFVCVCVSSSWSPGPLYFFPAPTHPHTQTHTHLITHSSTTTTHWHQLVHSKIWKDICTFFGMDGIWTSFFVG